MRKRFVLIVMTAFLLAIATVAMASDSLITGEIFEDVTESFYETEEDFTSSVDIVEDLSTQNFIVEENLISAKFAEEAFNTLNENILTKVFDETEQKKIKNHLINSMMDYNMTSSEISHINSLISEDYDMGKVLDIYEFLRWTNADISMLEEIYLAGIDNSDSKNWIYDAYDKVFNRTEDMLSVEDVAYYVSSGVTIDEIVGAYDLSFAGVKTTKQILDERISGLNWNSIAAEVISKTPQTVLDAPEMTINDVMKIRNYSVRTRKDVSDIIFIEDGAINIKDSVISEMQNVQKIKKSLIEKFDATLPLEEKDSHITNDDIAPVIEQDEYVFEEDYIPLEEPEVE